MEHYASVNLVVGGKLLMVPVTVVMYEGSDQNSPAGGVVEHADGTLQIMLDGRLSDDAKNRLLENAMSEICRRVSLQAMN